MNAGVIIGIIAFLVVLWGVGIGVTVFFLRRQTAAEERLVELTRGAQAVAAPKPTESGPRTGILIDSLNRALAGRGFAESITRDLARADIKLSVGEYLALHVILAVGAFAIVAFLRQDMIPGVVAALGSLFLPRVYVGREKQGRLTRFDNQLADMLNLVVNGLRAGYSVNQAMEAVSRELPAPISTEFKRVVQEMQIGLPMETALTNLTRRIPSKDLDFVATAMNIQREVGGNLAEILDTISFTIRERVRIKGEIETLTAQGMMTGYVISFLPIGLGVVLYFLNPKYLGMFFTSGFCGWLALIVAALLIIIGFSIVRKIVAIEV
ncbi:MAG: type II secretion system F family protein [Anaerolineales bacterium]|nr:type II secretion system F family protein [Anaerolineales bacterium]